MKKRLLIVFGIVVLILGLINIFGIRTFFDYKYDVKRRVTEMGYTTSAIRIYNKLNLDSDKAKNWLEKRIVDEVIYSQNNYDKKSNVFGQSDIVVVNLDIQYIIGVNNKTKTIEFSGGLTLPKDINKRKFIESDDKFEDILKKVASELNWKYKEDKKET
ncbi:hypothetical protein [Clostridium baratii]|uniref:hypothetical protein n=1 Tax=Clostridium baratii TaxID=1561 RepID=UPI0030D3BB78